jgi:hypothetical protein
MTLVPGSEQKDPMVFSTYDLEWWSSCEPACKAELEHPEHVHNYNHPKDGELRLVGVYDERGYRGYLTMAEFIKIELREKNWGRVFFAHAGGKFDFQYLFESMVKGGHAKSRFEIEMIFNGASAFLCTVRSRFWFMERYKFCDSMFLLKGSLREIGKKLGDGFYKGDIDFNTPDDAALREYNKQDCIVLYEALRRLQDEIRSLGGQMKPTLASSAMTLFATRFLKNPLVTNYPNSQLARNAYYASRVEVFRSHSDGGYHYDINSSFPWSMTQTLPGKYIGDLDALPDDPCNTPVIAELTVEVREDFLTPVPYRDKERRILFPTGRWRAWFGGPDIRLMLKCDKLVKIIQVHRVMAYEPFYDLSQYVELLYSLKASERGFKREVYKLLLNALYGKFGERQFKEKLLAFPRSTRCPHFWQDPEASAKQAAFEENIDKYQSDLEKRIGGMVGGGTKVEELRNGLSRLKDYKRYIERNADYSRGRKHVNDECMRRIAPNFYMREDFSDLEHVHVPIPVFVTGYSRELLYEYMLKCEKFYYVDTDSIDTGPNDGNLPTSDKLGDLKLEHVVKSADFVSPKLYRLYTQSKDGTKALIRSKGFPKLSDSDFERLLHGERMEVFRQRSLREAIRMQDIKPRKTTVEKGIVVREGVDFEERWLVRRTKRFLDFANNTSRPWRIPEIEKAYAR